MPDFINKITECEYLEFSVSGSYADQVSSELYDFIIGKNDDVKILKKFKRSFLKYLSERVFSKNLIKAGYDNYHYNPLECYLSTGLNNDFYSLFKVFLQDKPIKKALKLAYAHKYNYSISLLEGFEVTAPLLIDEQLLKRSYLIYLSQFDKYDYLFKDKNISREDCLCSYFYNIESCLQFTLITDDCAKNLKYARRKLKKMFRNYLLGCQ